MLNVFRRPEPFGGSVVALVEQRFERLANDRFVPFLNRLLHDLPVLFAAPLSRRGGR
jgi:hypothetical protein